MARDALLSSISEAVAATERKARSSAGGARQGGRQVLRQEILRWSAALRTDYSRMMKTARYNLNGNADNAVAEALALAHLYAAASGVMAEREMLRCDGCGVQVPGTPDGAVLLAAGRMAAVQVVRALAPRGRAGVSALQYCTLTKVRKSLEWILASGLGDPVVLFQIAVWIPRRLSARALEALRRGLSSEWLDPRFEVVLLVPPRGLRAIIFPPQFGEGRGDAEACRVELKAKAALVAAGGELSSDIRSMCRAWALGGAARHDNDADMGIMAEILASGG